MAYHQPTTLHTHFCGFGLGRFSFLASNSAVILKVSMSNLIPDFLFSSKIPRGSLPSSETCFIYNITSELARKVPNIAFIRPNAIIFCLSRLRFSYFSSSASVIFESCSFRSFSISALSYFSVSLRSSSAHRLKIL